MRVAARLFKLAAALARGSKNKNKRVELAPDLARSLEEIGELGRAEQILDEVDAAPGSVTEHLALLELASLRDYTRANKVSFVALEAAQGSALDPGTGVEHPEVETRASILEAEVNWATGQYKRMERPLGAAKTTAKKVQDPQKQRTLLNSIFGWKARAILLGPKEAGDGVSECDEILADPSVRGSHAVEAVVTAVRGGLHAMLGDFNAARESSLKSRGIGQTFGLDAWLAALPLYSGPIELLAGDPKAAQRKLRAGRDALERMGDRSRRATTAAFLAQALYDWQRYDEAGKFAQESEELASEDDVFTQVVWRGALAKVLARQGKCNAALALAERAVGMAPAETVAPNLRGDALLDQAVVQRLCNRPEAVASAEQAAAAYHTKGNVVAEKRAETLKKPPS
jgi:tetratricopeptide (TPR) repeat protein